jgi:S-DNA-T family DNA segregation ATPase FtsK/SpoIIIE
MEGRKVSEPRRRRRDAKPRAGNAKDESRLDGLWSGLARLAIHSEDLAAVVLGAAAALSLLGLIGVTRGRVVDFWVRVLQVGFGWLAYLLPVIMAVAAVYLVRRRRGQANPPRWSLIISLEVLGFVALGVLSIVDGVSLSGAEQGSGGGIVGWGIATVLEDLTGELGRVVILSLLGLGATFYLVRATVPEGAEVLDEAAADSAALRAGQGPPAASEAKAEARRRVRTKAKESSALPAPFRKNFRVSQVEQDSAGVGAERDERLPPLDLLDTGQVVRVTSQEINQSAGLIEKTLADFGLPARVVDFRVGPAITQFAVEPGFIEHTTPDGTTRRQKVRVGQISALANDLALALSAPALRIEAPVPGQSYVGIEVPNRRPAVVRMRPVLESEAFQGVGSPLAIALGRNVSGASVAADLAAMPHLLIAGTTGSGKSVCITALAACLIISNPPEDLRLVMIDPKMVELLRFNGLPHLYGRVETELERIVGVLRWCTVEMDRRYRLLEEAGARDVENYNRKVRRKRGAERLPRIVVFIDELADLMMMAPDQTERTLVRLAQMARATGIHLVVATQRPSTDIVTGLIKANFPARIAFAVASGVDSRVILDGPGAESLLGRGDMLFLSPEASQPVRLQGVMVSDAEVEQLVAYWKTELQDRSVEPSSQAPWEDLLARQAAAAEHDDVLERAIELVKQTGQASASMLQRRLNVGFPRAARLMDELEKLGVIGRSQSGGRTREVLVDRDEDTDSD